MGLEPPSRNRVPIVMIMMNVNSGEIDVESDPRYNPADVMCDSLKGMIRQLQAQLAQAVIIAKPNDDVLHG